MRRGLLSLRLDTQCGQLRDDIFAGTLEVGPVQTLRLLGDDAQVREGPLSREVTERLPRGDRLRERMVRPEHQSAEHGQRQKGHGVRGREWLAERTVH